MILDFQSYIALEPDDANAELIMGKLFNWTNYNQIINSVFSSLMGENLWK